MDVPHFVVRLDRFHLLAVVNNAVNICVQVCVDTCFHIPRSAFAGSPSDSIFNSKFSEVFFIRILRLFFLFKAINF